MPITVNILRGLCLAFQDFCGSQFEFLLFTAVFLLFTHAPALIQSSHWTIRSCFWGLFVQGSYCFPLSMLRLMGLLIGMMLLSGNWIALFDFISPRLTKEAMGPELDWVGPQILCYAQFCPWRTTNNVLFCILVPCFSIRMALP